VALQAPFIPLTGPFSSCETSLRSVLPRYPWCRLPECTPVPSAVRYSLHQDKIPRVRFALPSFFSLVRAPRDKKMLGSGAHLFFPVSKLFPPRTCERMSRRSFPEKSLDVSCSRRGSHDFSPVGGPSPVPAFLPVVTLFGISFLNRSALFRFPFVSRVSPHSARGP